MLLSEEIFLKALVEMYVVNVLLNIPVPESRLAVKYPLEIR